MSIKVLEKTSEFARISFDKIPDHAVYPVIRSNGAMQRIVQPEEDGTFLLPTYLEAEETIFFLEKVDKDGILEIGNKFNVLDLQVTEVQAPPAESKKKE